MNIKNKPWKPGKYNLGLWHAPHNIQFSGGFKKENLKTQKVQINSTLHSYN